MEKNETRVSVVCRVGGKRRGGGWSLCGENETEGSCRV